VGAAGAVEGILTLLSLENGVVPPTLNLENQDLDVKLDVVSGKPRQLAMTAAISNSFAFGGQNVSLLSPRPETEAYERTLVLPIRG
jgi:3-oxoacyl-[acyl-carrier-protein] synthase II